MNAALNGPQTRGVARAWMRLPSGAHLDLINPSPQAWTDLDLAVRLSRTYRWGGESKWPLPLSVAQHSLLVLELRRASAREPLDADTELQELLHDAEEGFLGFDCIAPLKPVLGAGFKTVANRLMGAVARRYCLRNWTPVTHKLHKDADHAAAASEAVHCAGWSIGEVRQVLAITAPIIDADPLAALFGGAPWEPWPSHIAAQRFLDALQSAVARRSAACSIHDK